MNRHPQDTNALGILAKTLNLSIPPHRIYQSPHQHNPYPIKRSAMQWIYGTATLVCLTLLNIFNDFKLEDWKAGVSLLGAVVMLGMWVHGKIKDRQHKNRMRELEYQEKLHELNRKLNESPYNEEKELGI